MSDGASTAAAELSRVEETCLHLERLAREAGPDGKLPTFVELRQQTGASVVTLNRALEALEARGTLYRRHAVGIFVSPRFGQKHVALVCNPSFFTGPEISPFWQSLLDQLRRHVADRGHDYSMHFAGIPDSPAGEPFFADFRRAVEERRVHAVLGVGLGGEAASWLEDRGVPLVGSHGETRYRVEVDFGAIARDAVKHLAGRGCRRIGLWLGHRFVAWPAAPEAAPELPPAVSAYREGLNDAGLPFDPALVVDSRSLRTLYTRDLRPTFWEQGYRVGLAVFGGTADVSRPDGIVSLSELFSQGALVALQQLGVPVGDGGVPFATHANEGAPVLEPWSCSITRFDVSPAAMAAAMLEMLETLLAGAEPAEPHLLHRARFSPPGAPTPTTSPAAGR